MKKYIILLLFFINFAFVFQHGKLEVTAGVEMKAQGSPEGGDGYFNGWTVDDFLSFINSPEAAEFGITGGEIHSVSELIEVLGFGNVALNAGIDNIISEYDSNLIWHLGGLINGTDYVPIGLGDIEIRAKDLDGDGKLDYKYVYNDTGELIYEGPVGGVNDDPITQTDEFLAWLEGNYGTEVPEVITDGIINDYYDYLLTGQENNGTGSSDPSTDATLTETERIAKLNTMVNDLNTKIKSKYGNNSQILPTVQYDPNYKGNGYAVFKNGNIYIAPRFFNKLATDGDRLSTLYHEYTHYVHDNANPKINHVNTDADGNVPVLITQIENSALYYNLDEYNYNYNDYLKDATPSQAKAYADSELKSDYKYKCSNYYKDEIEARETELQGEIDGLYVLTDSYRKEREDGIMEFTWKKERALNFEKMTPGYNNDGTPKK